MEFNYVVYLDKKTSSDVESVHTMDQFLDKSELVDFNLLDLVSFAEKSRLAQKVGKISFRYNCFVNI